MGRPIVIAGGGFVGLTLALALRRAAPRLAVIVLDSGRGGPGKGDLRASAITATAADMLTELGVWPAVAPAAQPIGRMLIGDTRPADIGRPVFLTFAGSIGEGRPFAHMVPNETLGRALGEACAAAGVDLRRGVVAADFEADIDAVSIKTRAPGSAVAGEAIAASLLVAADGARSRLRAFAGIGVTTLDYRQDGLVVTVEHERPHQGQAREDFLPAGPFAVLPLPGNRSSLVWTERREIAEDLVKADPLVFRAELERRFGHELGWVRPVGPVEAYPLGLVLARRFVAPRFALCGDAAHMIHPIAGQGLNLGFKDVAALAETLVEAARLGLDPGGLDVLTRYDRWRRYDTVEMALATDGLNRLFSNDIAPIRLLRDVGLGVVDRLPGLKEAFIRRAAGLGGEMPRLLLGRAI